MKLDLSHLDRDQLMRLCLHQDAVTTALIASNNKLLDWLGKPGTDAGETLRDWSRFVNAMVEASGREIARIVGFDDPENPNISTN